MDIELIHKPSKDNVVPDVKSQRIILRGDALGEYSNYFNDLH
jgi:hypothetical protein